MPPLRLLVAVCVAAVALGIAVHTLTTHTPAPGQILQWKGTSPSPTSQASLLTPRSSATASPTPAAATSIPTALWDRLNSDLAGTSAGQYAILQEIEGAIRDQLITVINHTTHQ